MYPAQGQTHFKLRRSLVWVVLSLASTIIVGCGHTKVASKVPKSLSPAPSTTPTVTSPQPTKTVSTAPTTPSSSSSDAESASSTTAASSATVRQCGTSQLAVSLVSVEGASQHFYSTFRATNEAKVSCTIDGFFGAAGFKGNTPVFESTVRQGSVQARTIPKGSSIKFQVITATGDKGGRTCAAITDMHLTPPNQKDFVVVPLGRSIPSCAAGKGTSDPTVTTPK